VQRHFRRQFAGFFAASNPSFATERQQRREPVRQEIKTLLMSDGRCEEAMDFCVSRFPDAAVTNIRRYGSGAEGSVKRASLSFRGRPSWRSIAP
jgi:hypothetical protein